MVDGRDHAVSNRVVFETPFCTLREYSTQRATTNWPRALLIAPLSGHFALLLREMVLGLLPTHRVVITDWINAAYIRPEAGPFGFDENIATVLEALAETGPDTTVIAACQAVVPALAAAAVAANTKCCPTPRALILIAGPVDPLANPTRVVKLLREHTLDWFEETMIAHVPTGTAGAGRRVYPCATQLAALQLYWTRHLWQGGELFGKTFADDGADPLRFPFLALYSALMDLSAEFFLENIHAVFHQCALSRGELTWRNMRVDCGALDQTALMTIEGATDDIAAPGQTRAAHALCPSIADDRRGHLLVPQCGHFSLIHGRHWWSTVRPAISAFLRDVA